MEKERKMELLAPAGNPEIFRAVISAGADAVYFGGDMFGARSYAQNFTASEGEQAIRFAHLHGRKAFLTVNTLIKNREMERRLYDFLKIYYEAGVDAVIVQDFGVFSFIRDFFPELPIHASTQMTVCTANGAQFLMKAGARRIVTARELSLEEIAQIYRRCGCEIETFVHGALCVCYSGQCLMSSLIGARSGNRGKCAQPCRLPYDVLDASKNPIKTPGSYVLSPKDLCAAALIPQMAEAGVYSLKIEGRMKKLSYAAGVVSVYRRYVDRYLEFGKEKYQVSRQDSRLLVDLGSRSGFTDAYLRGTVDKKMITFSEGAHRKDGQIPLPEQKKLAVKGVFQAKAGEPMTLMVSCGDVTVTGIGEQRLERAKKRATRREEIEKKLRKTGETPFVFEELLLDMDEGLFVPMTPVNALRQELFPRLEEELVKKNSPVRKEVSRVLHSDSGRRALERKSAGKRMECLATVKTTEQFEACVNDTLVTKIAVAAELPGKKPGVGESAVEKLAAEESAIRKSKVEESAAKEPEIEESARDLSFYLRRAAEQGKELYLMMPPVMRSGSEELLRRELIALMRAGYAGGVIAASYDELGLLEEISFPRERILLDHRLYTLNDRSTGFFEKMGYRMFTAPYELKETELLYRNNESSLLTVYGRAVLMITAGCLVKNTIKCLKEERRLFLRDRYKNQFPVLNRCKYCYNEIYNSKILCLFSEAKQIRQMNFSGIRLDFTLENKKETLRVLREAENAFLVEERTLKSGGPRREEDQERQTQTKGHWRRGVE